MRNILILGGTTEAGALAARLAERGETAVLSYAGRVEDPKPQPVETRVGGFGGAAGLADYIRVNNVTHLVDATHPFAAQISGNAVLAVQDTGIPLIALSRAPWQPVPGDAWQSVPDIAAAVAALAGPARRIFLALGRMHLAQFAARPQHHYILRLVDPPVEAPPLPHHTVIIARGPFDPAGDMALLTAHHADLLVAKNAGGKGASAKLAAARSLGLPVLMIDRPRLPPRPEVQTVAQVIAWLDHGGTDRGV
jgi:precorrin-6A/cobalt-precorrin-6A reductase